MSAASNPAPAPAPAFKFRCLDCKQDLDGSDFYWRNGRRTSYCKECKQERSRAAYAAGASKRAWSRRMRNPENRKAARAAHVVSGQKRRATIAALEEHFAWSEFLALCVQQKHRCFYCGRRRTLTVDHVVPLSKGGLNDITNIVGACRPCNTRKGTRSAEEFQRIIEEERNVRAHRNSRRH